MSERPNEMKIKNADGRGYMSPLLKKEVDMVV
jgi:hypothetical protein